MPSRLAKSTEGTVSGQPVHYTAELGDAIAENTHVESLEFINDPDDLRLGLAPPVKRRFIDGISRNSSIHDLRLSFCDISPGSTTYEILESFRTKGNLMNLSLRSCRLENGGGKVLASTIKTCKSINYLSITQSGVNDDIMERLAKACAGLHLLKALELARNAIGRGGCESLASLLQSPNSSLITICLGENNIDDSGAAAIARSLSKNTTLRKLYLDHNAITSKGWDAFYTILCNTSTINATYSSNHTLTSLGGDFARAFPDNLSSLLVLNKDNNKKDVATKKILLNHPQLNVGSLFQWDMKMIPLVIDWLDRSKSCTDDLESINARKLDSLYQCTRAMAVYQFTRAMPTMLDKNPSRTLSIILSMIVLIVAYFSLWLYPNFTSKAVKARW